MDVQENLVVACGPAIPLTGCGHKTKERELSMQREPSMLAGPRTGQQLIGELKAALAKASGVTFVSDPSDMDVLAIAIKFLEGEDVSRIPGVTGQAAKKISDAIEAKSASGFLAKLSGDEKLVMQKALADSGGKFAEAWGLAQARLIEPWTDRGYTAKGAVAQLKPQYPNIFQHS
jgi:hypothetical protein